MMPLGIAVVLAYLLGSISGSLTLGKFRHVDIRTMGSGNAGGTNALRSVGFTFALGVMVVDVGKGALAAGLVPALTGSTQPSASLWCGFAAIFGHCYPLWHGFRGGKGAATLLGVLAVVNPWLLLPVIGAWLLVLVFTGFVGLATVTAVFALIPGALWLGGPPGVGAFAVVVACFIAFTHRSNFRNMAAGTEHRHDGVRLSRWLGRSGAARPRDE